MDMNASAPANGQYYKGGFKVGQKNNGSTQDIQPQPSDLQNQSLPVGKPKRQLKRKLIVGEKNNQSEFAGRGGQIPDSQGFSSADNDGQWHVSNGIQSKTTATQQIASNANRQPYGQQNNRARNPNGEAGQEGSGSDYEDPVEMINNRSSDSEDFAQAAFNAHLQQRIKNQAKANRKQAKKKNESDEEEEEESGESEGEDDDEDGDNKNCIIF